MTKHNTWEQTKTNFNAALTELGRAGTAHAAMEREWQDAREDTPERVVAYEEPGFTDRHVTLAPHKTTYKLTPSRIGDECVPEAVKASPEYAEFCAEVEAFSQRHDALRRKLHCAKIERDWDRAIDAHTKALRALIACPVATVADVSEKIALAGSTTSGQSLAGLDEDELRALVAAVSRDLGPLA